MLGFIQLAKPAKRLADPVQRLRRSPRVLSFSADLECPSLVFQRGLPVTGGLTDQGGVLQQSSQQRLVPFRLWNILQTGERLAHEGRRGVYVAGEVFDLSEEIGPPAHPSRVGRGTGHVQADTRVL